MQQRLRAMQKTLPIALCIIGGALATIIIALLAAFLTPRPTSWQFSNEHTGKVAEYRELAREIPESERIVIMTSFGLAHRALDIRYYDAAAVAIAQYPPEKRRSFQASFGWPNHAFRTSSRMIGARFCDL